MKAVRLSEPGGTLAVVDIPVPEPGPGEVRVRIEASGVCYTDIHIADGEWREVDGLVARPVVLGHEGAGVVEALGEGVTSLAIGDRVGVPFLRSACGRCRRCLEGEENVCAAPTAFGMSHDGCHAEAVVAVAAYVVKIPDGLSSEQAAPLCCAGVTVYGAISRAGLRPGDGVAVLGVGGLGHLAIQIAKAFGARVVAVDIDDAKLDLARRLGADECLLATDPQVAQRLSAQACEVVAVTTIAPSAHELAVAAVAPGGTVLLCAVPGGGIQVSAVLAIFKGITFLSQAVGSRQDLVDTFALAASGKLHCEIHTEPLAAAPRVFDDLRNSQVVGRVVLVP